MYTLIIFVVSLTLVYYFSIRRPTNYPPGPNGYPIIGNYFQVKDSPHKTLTELGKTYGDIIGLYLGPSPYVILNNYKLAREAFAEHVFSGRRMTHAVLDRNLGGNRGITFAYGKSWMQNRRFMLKNLRDFGFGRKSMEGLIMAEVQALIATFRRDVNQPIDTHDQFHIAVLNALWIILTGERFNQDDPRILSLIQSLTTVTRKKSITKSLASLFPIIYYLRKLLPFLFEVPVEAFNRNAHQVIREIVEQHKDSLPEDAPRDFIDAYLKEILSTQDPKSPFYKQNGELGLRVVILDLLAAGAETASTTLMWTFLLLALNSDAQDKLFQEIQRVVGLSRYVSLTDRPQMPFLDATIHEVLRLCPPLPIGAPHKTIDDVQFHGYTIPKDTIIFANIYKAAREESVWEDPESFRPERFINADGTGIARPDAWMPFSVGKRVCPGEALSKDELFLFTGNLLQAFEVTTVPGEPKPTLDTFPSLLMLDPKPHRLVLKERLAS